MISRSSSFLSSGDEHGPVREDLEIVRETKQSNIDDIFDLIHDLKQKDLEEHKRRIEQQKGTNNVDGKLSLEPEPEKKTNERVYNFKYLPNNQNVWKINPGNPEDLRKIVVPTNSMKINSVFAEPKLTKDIQSLIIKTTATRFGQNQPSHDTPHTDVNYLRDSDPHIERKLAVKSDSSTTKVKGLTTSQTTGFSSETNICQDVTEEVAEVITETIGTKTTEIPKKNPQKASTWLTPETNMVKSTSANTVSQVTRKYSPFSLKPSASSPGFSYFSSNRDSEKEKKVNN